MGCGAILQSLDQTKPGYIPPSADAESKMYCQRCFHIRNHNLDYSATNLALMKDKKEVLKRQASYRSLLSNIKDEECLVLLMIDVLDIYTGFIDGLDQLIGSNPVWVLANKTDLLPKDLKLAKMKEKIIGVAKNHRLDVNNVFFISATREQGVKTLVERMLVAYNKSNHPVQNIYLVGATSVGKSTFINMILNHYGEIKNPITTSIEPNTTSDLIKIAIGKNKEKKDCYIIDTPGYLNEKSILSCAPLNTLKVLIPKNFIRVKTYQLKGEQTLFLGGLVRIDLVSEKVSLSSYVSDRLYIHRTKTINKDQAYHNLKFKELVPPFDEEELAIYGPLKTYNLESKGQLNIWLSGIGIIHIVGDAKIVVAAPEMINVTEDQDDLS